MQKGSIRLFRIRGIQLSVHITFLLLLAYVAWEGWSGDGAVGAIVNVVSMLAFFACVVLHELGHSFTARAFGITVPRILLLPIGGMAEFSHVPRRPSQEILIAVAGPAVNAVLAAILALIVPLPTWEQILAMDVGPLQLLLVMNIVMGTFNLLPAFPMDGGRVLRALLAIWLPYLNATAWAVGIGKVLAFAGIVVMGFVFKHAMGAILFLFIMIAGELEYRTVLRQEKEERRWREFIDRLYVHSSGPAEPAPPPL